MAECTLYHRLLLSAPPELSYLGIDLGGELAWLLAQTAGVHGVALVSQKQRNAVRQSNMHIIAVTIVPRRVYPYTTSVTPLSSLW